MGIFSKLQKVEGYSPWQFSFFRIIFGIYLLIHFSHMMFWGGELFGKNGLVAESSMNPGFGKFPFLFFLNDDPFFVSIVLGTLVFLSLLFTLGIYRNFTAFLLWYGWASLLHRNIFISNPGIPFVGWLMLACVLIPPGEPLSFSFKRKTISVKNWQMPGMIFYGAWLIMAAGYTISGIHKLGSPSWIDGSAVLHLLHNPLARDTFIRGFILEAPVWFFNVLSWSALFLEIAFLPLAAFRKTRWIAWTGIVFMHLGILTVVNFADLTAGVLMIHLFTVDPLWFPSRKFAKNKNPPVIYFDGFCILCNGFVDFLLEEDKSHLYRFSALQSEAAKSALSGIGKIPDSVVLYDNGNLYFRSDAAIKIISSLGGIWKILVVFYLVPRFLRDPVYDFIAKSRYTWFGKKDSCRIPSDEEKQYFIDS